MKIFLTALAMVCCTYMATSVSAAPQNYRIDSNHTFASFEFNHLGYSFQRSRFDKVRGNITLDQVKQVGSATIDIDVASINTGSVVFNGHLRGEDFFNAEKFPVIEFKSTSFNFLKDRLSTVNGNLTIKGVTHPVTLEVTHFKCMMHPMLNKPACGANAVATIQRSAFNMGKYVPNIADDINLSIAIEAIQE